MKVSQVTTKKIEPNLVEFHLAYLLSNRGVKDSFNRKLTTIVLMGREMRGETRRHTELSKARIELLQDALYRGKSKGVGLIISQTY